MSNAVELVANNKVPVSKRTAQKDKGRAATEVASHALGIFNDAVEQLKIANALLQESISDDQEDLRILEERIDAAREHQENNARVLNKIDALLA